MTSQSSGVATLVGDFLSWIVREHCTLNPEAVAKAWEQMNAEAPTLADAGRMFAAYGADFTIAELRYIARHPEALRLARNAAALVRTSPNHRRSCQQLSPSDSDSKSWAC